MNLSSNPADRRSNAELLDAARDGDRLALAEFAARELPGLYSALHAYLKLRGQGDVAEDVCQSVILKVIRKIQKAAAKQVPVGDLRASWLFCVGKRIAIDMFRKERRKSLLRKAEHDQFDEQGSAQTDRKFVREQIEACLDLLPDLYRPLFRCIYIEGLSTQEAACQLGLSKDAAYKREQRGLSHLRLHLSRNIGMAVRIFG